MCIILIVLTKSGEKVRFIRELAKEILSLDTSNPKYLKDINQYLNAAVPGMDLFVWAMAWSSLHITDLSQNLDFKNILKKKGLI